MVHKNDHPRLAAACSDSTAHLIPLLVISRFKNGEEIIKPVQIEGPKRLFSFPSFDDSYGGRKTGHLEKEDVVKVGPYLEHYNNAAPSLNVRIKGEKRWSSLIIITHRHLRWSLDFRFLIVPLFPASGSSRSSSRCHLCSNVHACSTDWLQTLGDTRISGAEGERKDGHDGCGPWIPWVRIASSSRHSSVRARWGGERHHCADRDNKWYRTFPRLGSLSTDFFLPFLHKRATFSFGIKKIPVIPLLHQDDDHWTTSSERRRRRLPSPEWEQESVGNGIMQGRNR